VGGLLWETFSHPSTIAGEGDGPVLLVGAAIVALLTLAFMATIGKRIARRSRTVAVLAGAAFLPGCVIALAYGLLISAPEGPPPNDAPAMLFGALFVLAICATPVSFLTSVAYIVRRRSTAGDRGC
jgi:drug/metabolite transporter (DMT)-like permease